MGDTPDGGEKTWYRAYVVCMLLLVSIHNLTARNLPSYLITIPVPGCEDICAGVATTPLCDTKTWDEFTVHGKKAEQPSNFEVCQICRARSLPAMLMALDEQEVAKESEHKTGAMPEWISKSHMDLPKDTSRDANFYNLADGSCLKDWQYGILIGYGFAIVFAVGSIPASMVCDRKSRVAVLGFSCFAWSVATALQASSHTFLFLLFCRSVLGLAQAFAMPAGISLMTDYFGLEKQGTVHAVVSVGMYLGAGSASFAILIGEGIGWRWSVLLTGITGIMLSLVMYVTVKEPDRTEWSASTSIGVVSHEVFTKSRVAKWLVLAASAKMLSAYCLSAYLPLWYSRKFLEGYSNNDYAIWNAIVVSSGGLISTVCGSQIGEWWGKRDSRAACWIGVFGAVVSLPFLCMVLCAQTFATSMIFWWLNLLVSECWFGPTVTLLQASVRRSMRGQAVSMFLCASTLAANLGPALLGILDNGQEGVGMHILWICLAANVAAAVAFMGTAYEVTVDPVAGVLSDREKDDNAPFTGRLEYPARRGFG